MSRKSQNAKKNNARDVLFLSKWLTEMGINWDGDISQIKVLDLAREELTNLPESIGQLTNLQTLILDYNRQLTSLPESIGRLTNLRYLELNNNQLTSLPESIGQLTHLQKLNLSDNQLTNLPESLGQLTNLRCLELNNNQLTSLPESIGQLTNLRYLELNNNQLTSLPESLGQLTNLRYLELQNNPINHLSPAQKLDESNLQVRWFSAALPDRYWTETSDWEPAWLLDENNAEIRRILIENVGYEKICTELGAEEIDRWREYILLKLDGIQPTSIMDMSYRVKRESMMLLKMTCPSTGHAHILRVPPATTSAEEAITWVNHGIHPDRIAIAT